MPSLSRHRPQRVKSYIVAKRPPAGLVRKFAEGLPDQVSSSSSDCCSKSGSPPQSCPRIAPKRDVNNGRQNSPKYIETLENHLMLFADDELDSSDMERSWFYGFSEKNSAQKRKRDEGDETLDRSKAKEKPADKKKRSNGETSGASADTTTCSVCLDTVSSSIMKSLPCAHAFHEICINEWLKKSFICPICRWPTTVDTNDSPHMGAAGSRGTFENYGDVYNESAGSELGRWNNDFELGEWRGIESGGAVRIMTLN
ncbi:hypothetical protein AVEN_135091-1 [Araneus ventricosus]|uniref:RING-type E3 ubiquitin transferase n=1 Tax=Araneus ventricosus TaxID=182803 RepID=A0A4Y2S8P1_ARAVE|nr:hypothetical protein AVEN_135091-1 [Araneus ventricosus]